MAQEIGRTAGSEYRAGSATAKGCACIRALALLDQDQRNQGHRDKYQDDFKDRVQHEDALNNQLNGSQASLAYRHKLACLQRGTAYQATINIRHAEQFGSVGSLDAAAVQQADDTGYFSIMAG